VVISEETGTLSLANQGRLERPITSSRLQDLLTELIASSVSSAPVKSPSGRSVSSGTQESLP
ncbi:MAG: phosphoesterase, partial [Cyanobacteriota bacterium]|nr:phosphoesterase [Cyanobacteriota bacterium]